MIQWSRHLRHKFLPCIYIVEWSLLNLPTTDNIATNIAEEWRFHINNNWYVVLKIEESKIHLFERTTKWPDLWSQTMRSFIPKRIVSYIIKPHPPSPSILGSRSDQKVLVIIIIHFIHNIIYKELLTIIMIIIIILIIIILLLLLLLLIIVVTA